MQNVGRMSSWSDWSNESRDWIANKIVWLQSCRLIWLHMTVVETVLQGSWMFRPSPFPGGCGRVVRHRTIKKNGHGDQMWMKIVQSSILNTGSNWNFPQLTPRQERHPMAARRSESWILVALELVTTRRQGKKYPSENWRLEVDSQVWEVMAKKFVAVLDLNSPVWTNSHRTFCFCIKGSISLQSMSQHFFFQTHFSYHFYFM